MAYRCQYQTTGPGRLFHREPKIDAPVPGQQIATITFEGTGDNAG